MRLAWCDKIALVWGGFLFLLLASAWQGGWIFWNGDLPPIWLGAWQFGWWLVGIPWLLLRLIDLAAGGPLRRQPGMVRRWAMRAYARMQYNRAVNYGLITPTLNGRAERPED